MKILLGKDVSDYDLFLKIKALPSYRFVGRMAEFPDCYAERLGLAQPKISIGEYRPIDDLFDYQVDVSRLAIERRKFAVFARPGLGKTLIGAEFARHAQGVLGPSRRVLITSPLMVIRQTISECKRFYSDKGINFGLEQIRKSELARWIQEPGPLAGITNYEALSDDLPQGILGALICDESSIMKSSYGKTGQHLLRLGAGLDWKLCLTGTPAPNDRIEFANHAVFLDAFPTINSFLARYFVNRGQTQERWVIKPHAIEPFYRGLSHWSIFLNSPATYGWKDNAGTIPPIHVHIHDVDLSSEQQALVGQELGMLFPGDIGGITKRSKLSQIAKGQHNGKAVATHKPQFMRTLIDQWIEKESTIIWCRFNPEQRALEKWFPEAVSIKGTTPYEKRSAYIEGFQKREHKIIISKPDLLGLGLNLQVATRQVFSSCEDSYEDYVQAIMRSNRVGSVFPLNVHIPVTDAERPMLDNVLRKAKRVDEDMAIQEQLFIKQSEWGFSHV